MPELFEIIMLIMFGISWPMNIVRSVRAKTAKGKSFWFLLFILIGYVAGIIAKLINPVYFAEIHRKWYVLVFYVINFVMVFIDLCLYFRNRRRDAQNETKFE